MPGPDAQPFTKWLGLQHRAFGPVGDLARWWFGDVRRECALPLVPDPATVRRHLSFWHSLAPEHPLLAALDLAEQQWVSGEEAVEWPGGAT